MTTEYARLEERILARDQVGASQALYTLFREKRPVTEIVRETVMHELGHYFGLDDDTMHKIEDGEVD